MIKEAFVTVLICAIVAIGIAGVSGHLDWTFEPDPKVGDVWVPSFATAQPYWPSFWDSEVIDVRGEYVRIKRNGMFEEFTLHNFHAKYNPAKVGG